MNSQEILARIPARHTGTQKEPNMYAIGVSKHGAIHFHMEIEGELYITTLRVKSTAKSKNSPILRCIQKKCLSAIGVKFPENFKGAFLDPASYYEFFKNNVSDFNLREFKYVHFNPYKHIHTCDAKKVNARNVMEYDLYPRPVGNDNTIAGTLTIPQFNKNPKRFDKWDYHPDAKRLRIHEEMTRGPTTEYVELTAYQVNNNDYLQNQLQDRIDLNTVPKDELSKGLEYTDPVTGKTFRINEPHNQQISTPVVEVKQEDEINDDTSLTIVVNEHIKEETKTEIKEEPEVVVETKQEAPASEVDYQPFRVAPSESALQLAQQSMTITTLEEPKEEPVSDDDFQFHVRN